MQPSVQEAKKEEKAIQLVEEHLLALKQKLEELVRIEKDLSREIALLKEPQSQTAVPAHSNIEPQAKVDIKEDEEERYLLDPKTGTIEKKRVKKAIYIEAKP